MFKIYLRPNNKYDIHCYLYDKNTHSNQEIWAILGIAKEDMAHYMQQDKDKEPKDLDWAFVVLKSGNGPVIFTDANELLPVPVKVPVKIKGVTNGSRIRATVKELLFSGTNRKASRKTSGNN